MKDFKNLQIIDKFIECRIADGHSYFLFCQPREYCDDQKPLTMTNVDNKNAYKLIEDWLDDYKNADQHYERAYKWSTLVSIGVYTHKTMPDYNYLLLARALPGYGNQQMRAITNFDRVSAYKTVDNWYRHVYDRPNILDNY